MKTVLVTGAGGFAARFVVPKLEQAGLQVFESVRPGSRCRSRFGSTTVSLDLRDELETKHLIADIRPNYIFHLASKSYAGSDNIEEYYSTNTIGGINLLRAVVDANYCLEKFLTVSSGAIYGSQTDQAIAEDVMPKPPNDYAISKLAFEHACQNYRGLIPIVVARPFNFTGRGQNKKFLIPKIVEHFKERASKIKLGNIHVSRDYSDVRYVAEALVGLLLKGKPGEAYNISTAVPVKLIELISICEEITGHSINIEVDKSLVRRNDPEVIVGSNHKLLNLNLGVNPIDIETTLRWMLE